MCVIAWAWRARPDCRLVVLANRDEYHGRAAEPLHRWPDAPGILAGRDAEAGGTWLGVGRGGRFAAVTNRPGPRPGDAPSRGGLPADYLRSSQPAAAAAAAVAERAGSYAGFNLLLADADTLAFVSNRESAAMLVPGVGGMANDALAEDAPKVRELTLRLGRWAAGASPAQEAQWFAWLADDEAAADGAPTSAIFVRGETYGTRSSTVLVVAADGSGRIVERRFGPGGHPLGETALAWAAPA